MCRHLLSQCWLNFTSTLGTIEASRLFAAVYAFTCKLTDICARHEQVLAIHAVFARTPRLMKIFYRRMFNLAFAALLALHTACARVDTRSWLGAEYTPAGASNSLWWAFYDDYESAIQRELG